MAWTKTSAVISNNIGLSAGGGTTTTASQNTTTTGVKHVYIKITNGSTGPVTAASAVVQTSANNTDFYNFATFVGATGNNAIASISIQVMAPIEYIRIIWTAADTQNVTARAEFSQISEVANVVDSNRVNVDTYDAYSRLRVSNPTTVFDSQFTYDLQPLIFEQIVSGTGATVTYDSTNRMALMTFSSTPGGSAYMQSFEYFRYQPDKSQLIFIAFNMKGGSSLTTNFAGYSDGTNGIEFQLNETIPQFIIYSGTTQGNQTVAQGGWNIDTFDGTGISGLTLDTSKVQILVIDLQGDGRVRLGFDVNGIIYYAHQFTNANIILSPYIQNINLPIRCGMTCVNTDSTTMDFISASVLSEGGDTANVGYSMSFNSPSVNAGNGTATYVMSLRPKTTFNSITNRSKFVLESIQVVCTSATAIYWQLCLDQAITGTTTFNDVNATYSAMQYNTAGTLSGTPTIILASGYCGGSSQISQSPMINKYPIALDKAGAVRSLGTLTMLVTGLTAASNGVYVTLNWREIR